jgi:hypothetical protein
MDSTIIGANDPRNRDLKTVKTCETCGKLFHPRTNGYQLTSSFCSRECYKKSRRGQFFGSVK